MTQSFVASYDYSLPQLVSRVLRRPAFMNGGHHVIGELIAPARVILHHLADPPIRPEPVVRVRRVRQEKRSRFRRGTLR